MMIPPRVRPRNNSIAYRLASICAMTCAACIADEPTRPPAAVDRSATLEDAIAPQLRAEMQAGGVFRLAGPGPQDGPIIDETEAVTLAEAFIRSFGRYFRTEIEQGHGKPVSISQLTAADRVYFAETPDAALPATAAGPFRKAYGPYYLVTLVDAAAVPVVSVAVSAYSTDLVVHEDGSIRFPLQHGNEFMWHAIPLGREIPLSPETAVRLVYERTGARASKVPVLVKPRTRTWSPHYARWRIDLDVPIRMSLESGGVATTSTLFVDTRERFVVPLDQQQRVAIFKDLTGATRSVTLAPRLGLQGSFVEVRQ
jgi:hypothetical protein